MTGYLLSLVSIAAGLLFCCSPTAATAESSVAAPDLSVCPRDRIYEVIIAVDVSSWFRTYKEPIIDGLNSFLTKFNAGHPYSRFLLTTFSDYPLPPYGCAAEGDHCFKKQSEMWSGPGFVKQQLKTVPYTWGYDVTESADTAINHIAHATDLFSSMDTMGGVKVERMIIVVSDAGYHHGRSIQNPPMEFKCVDDKYQVDCCKPFGLTGQMEPKAYTDFRFIPNRNAKDNFVECGFDKEGKYSGIFEGFPDPTTMYGKLAERKIGLLALISSSHGLPNKPYQHWIKNYQPLAKKAGGSLHVADWHTQDSKDAAAGFERLVELQCETWTTTTKSGD